MKVKLPVFGDKAKAISECLRLKNDGNCTGINVRVFFKYRSVEGHPKITIEMDI